MLCHALFLALLAAVSIAAKAPSAWNGHTDVVSHKLAPFTPYYVPPGAKSYDSASPLVHYTGKWHDTYSSAYVHKSLRWTSARNAAVQLTFTGTGIEVFGNAGKKNGAVKVYIDGKLVQEINPGLDVVTPYKQQRTFWKFDLVFGKHTIKLVNEASKAPSGKPGVLDLDAFVVTRGRDWAAQPGAKSSPPTRLHAVLSPRKAVSASADWKLTQEGTTGVHAMQLAVISTTHALVVDKVEHNPLTVDGHPAWAALYNLDTHALTPITMQSNSFCAGGSFLSNGTLINVGGNPIVEDHTASADFGDVDGLQAIRLVEPCDSGDCTMYENHDRIRMAVLDGTTLSAIIIGGSKKGGWINNATVNNPTVEYFPPKNIHGSKGMPVHVPFLDDTLPSNLFPLAFALPDGTLFMAANRDAMIYDWENNKERRLPQLPNGVRVTYPMAGTAVLLPLSPANDYAPEVLVCGGSAIDDSRPSYEMTSQEPASAQCVRMTLTNEGIARGWEVEQMPEARLMPDAVLLPTGQVLLVNGAGTGISGYGNVRNQIGASNADHPVLTPVLYDPAAPAGHRFSSDGMPTSDIPRMYHSVATLTPRGDVMIAGSNPNLDRSEMRYGTEYRVEWLAPPICSRRARRSRMQMRSCPSGRSSSCSGPHGLGYVTHAVHANSRLVELQILRRGDGVLEVAAPPSGKIYPPGPGFCTSLRTGAEQGDQGHGWDGQGPPVDEAAIANVLSNSQADQYEKTKEDSSSE
ncbi:glyoxal oxidase N-terminus-domain-containing protein [Schizophyllum amplum]|uniref:Glyoxal oxidase N-terminus-domain-containing protein n=1 Tax=Schizophyllum amplum TaxID=97359 RepID=A0A550CCM0_9AGAR|nr:glyoxal oxidase N-terminus-domain-containing protein [Auriculariopsis ampla]